MGRARGTAQSLADALTQHGIRIPPKLREILDLEKSRAASGPTDQNGTATVKPPEA